MKKDKGNGQNGKCDQHEGAFCQKPQPNCKPQTNPAARVSYSVAPVKGEEIQQYGSGQE
jgi:hypothetical protein